MAPERYWPDERGVAFCRRCALASKLRTKTQLPMLTRTSYDGSHDRASSLALMATHARQHCTNLHHTTKGEAAHACLDCHGGYGYAAEYDVERKFRETRLYKTAPINNNRVLAYIGQHVLGMPRSY